jgi:hypothetical protein
MRESEQLSIEELVSFLNDHHCFECEPIISEIERRLSRYEKVCAAIRPFLGFNGIGPQFGYFYCEDCGKGSTTAEKIEHAEACRIGQFFRITGD